MVKSFINNGWCVQIRGPQAGGRVKDLPIHLYDLGTGNQVKIPSEVMIPETREFEFASLGFIPLSYFQESRLRLLLLGELHPEAGAVRHRRRHRQQPHQCPPAVHLPAVAHCALPEAYPARKYRHHQDRRLLELELNTWVRGLVTEMTDPGDELQASHRCATRRWWWKTLRTTGILPREAVRGAALPGGRDGRQPVAGFSNAESQIVR